MDLVWYVLASIAGFFFVWLAIKPFIDKKLNVKMCAVCAAVVSTWIVLLATNLLGFVHSQLLLAILMGQSIAGATYLMEKYEKLKGFKIVAIIAGTAIVYYILTWIG
ncbi:MAG: hypothetical protein HY438_03110 [DPANN group archaeon]|nr:hypothetical protein [DPANN group archaeon]